MACSSDMKFIACDNSDFNILIYDTENRNGITLKGHTDSISGIAFNPREKYELASCSIDTHIILWNVQTGILMRSIVTFSILMGVAYSPDGSEVVVMSNNDIQIQKVQKTSLPRTLKAHKRMMSMQVCI